MFFTHPKNRVIDHHEKVVALWRAFKQRLSNATQIYEASDLSTLLESCNGFQDLEAHFLKKRLMLWWTNFLQTKHQALMVLMEPSSSLAGTFMKIFII